jgi:hypothetical protein
LKPHPLAEHQSEREPGRAGVDVHRGPAGEVDCREVVGDPAARGVGTGGRTVEGKHPVRHREVHDGGPDAREEQPGAEAGTVGDGTADQGHRDDREHALEPGERRCRDGEDQCVFGHQALKAEELRRVAEQPATDVVAESKGVAVQHP